MSLPLVFCLLGFLRQLHLFQPCSEEKAECSQGTDASSDLFFEQDPFSQQSSQSMASQGSSYVPSSYMPSQETESKKRAALDSFLTACGSDPTDRVLSVDWQSASDRTRRAYLNKLDEVVHCASQVLAGPDADLLIETYLQKMCCSATEDVRHDQLLDALVEAYKNMEGWAGRRQMLSVLADKYTFREIKERLPGITQYHVTAARDHIRKYGHGGVVPKQVITRCRVTTSQIEHFVEFLCSPHIMQDLPCGEKVLKLSTGEMVRVPKVVLVMIPEHLIAQYQAFCDETHFQPPAPSTLRRILHSCSTTYRYVLVYRFLLQCTYFSSNNKLI